MPGLRLVRAAAGGCALVLAAAVVATAAQAPQRLLYGLLQVLVVLALVAPHLAIAWLLRAGGNATRIAWGLLLARATGWATLVLASGLLYLACQAARRTGQHPGVPEILLTCLLLLPLVIALLFGARRLAAARVDARVSLARALPAALAVGVSFLALPVTLSWQSEWQASWYAESIALGDLRTMVSAQAVYAGENGQAYGPPECLVAPRECLPAYGGPALLEPPFLKPIRAGYLHVFFAGPPPLSGARPRSYRAWAYVALPEAPGVTGVRGFCADESGAIYVIPGERLPTVAEGRCPAGEPLR